MVNILSFYQSAAKSPKNGQRMGILNDLLERVESVGEGLAGGAMIGEVVIRHEDDILDLQKIQLLQGLSSSGEDIRPYYSEDLKPSGYFKNAESAKRYSVWKENDIRYPYSVQRNPDAPNLYINGKFHSELGVQFDVASVAVIGTTPYAKGIIAKYGLETFGLMGLNWDKLFRERGALGELLTEIRTELYGTS